MNRLTQDDAEWANDLLDRIREELDQRAEGDPVRLHMLRRKVVKKLGYDEKSTPMERKALKKRKMIEQNGLCSICGNALPEGVITQSWIGRSHTWDTPTKTSIWSTPIATTDNKKARALPKPGRPETG